MRQASLFTLIGPSEQTEMSVIAVHLRLLQRPTRVGSVIFSCACVTVFKKTIILETKLNYCTKHLFSIFERIQLQFS
jgi:hypothetical protein